MTIKQNEESEIVKETIPVDVERIKNVFSNLKNDTCHSLPTILPCCKYNRYKKPKGKGGKFDEESFFLDWLEYEIRFSKLKVETDLIYKDELERDPGEPSITEIYRGSWREYFKIAKTYKEVSDFIKKYLPESGIDPDPKRIKMKIWRLRKSRIVRELEPEIGFERLEKNPVNPEKKRKQKEIREDLRFVQKVANFIYSQPKKKVNQRDLLRFLNKKIEDLEPIIASLKSNYGIQIKSKEGYRKKTTFYIGTLKSSRGRYWRVGI